MERKKNTRHRGSGSHKRGHKKKARGAGNRGGRGMSGLTKHKKFKMFKEFPDHMGSRGFRSLQQKGFRKATRSINLSDLIKLGGNEFDVTSLGYEKVLGTGKLTTAITVKAAIFSERAKQKIEKAGGKAVQV